jgi:hypothetical protein
MRVCTSKLSPPWNGLCVSVALGGAFEACFEGLALIRLALRFRTVNDDGTLVNSAGVAR